MLEVTLTVSGSIAEVERVLKLMEQVEPTRSPELVGTGQASGLADFVRGIDQESIRIISHLAEHPATEFTAEELSAALTIDVQSFYGFVGVIGRAWKKAFGAAQNPFASQSSRVKRSAVWFVTIGFAVDLKRAMEH